MRHLLPLLFAAALTTALAAAPTTDLWDGHDLSGWKFITNPAVDITTVCHATADGALEMAGKPIGYVLVPGGSHRNFRLHAEWRWTGRPGNSGILVDIASGPKDRQWPLCFQIQLKANRAGDVLLMAGATCAEMASPKATTVEKYGLNSEKAPGKWNSCDITCRDGTIECSVNGVTQNRVTRCDPAEGTIGFQFEGTPYELRNIRLTPLD